MTQFGPYEIIRRLGVGASAEVFLARGPNPKNAGVLALKLILPHLQEDEGYRAMLLREARAVAPLQHPNVVTIYDVGEIDGRAYLAMEWVDGWPLNMLLRALRQSGGRLSVAEAAHIVREAALGLHHAHEAVNEAGEPLGLVHRDVSPHNLMVSRLGSVKVVDFGLARVTHVDATRTGGGVKGKLRYMPPEQIRSQPLDRRADVFALGAILWELVVGTQLRPGANEAEVIQQALFAPLPHPDEVARGLPREIVDLLQRAVHADANRRTPSALALAEALEPFLLPDGPQLLARTVGRLLDLDTTPRDPERPSGLSQTWIPKSPTVSETYVPPVRPPTPVASEAPRSAPAPTPSLPPPQQPRHAPAVAELPRVKKRRMEPAARPSPFKDAPNGRENGRSRPGTPVGVQRATPETRWLIAAAVAVCACAVLGTILWQRARDAEAPKPLPRTESQGAKPSARPPPPSPRGRSPVGRTGASQATASASRGEGTIILTSSEPAVVSADGRELGITPLTTTLGSGRHRLVLTSIDKRRTTSVEIDVSRDGTVKRHIHLPR